MAPDYSLSSPHSPKRSPRISGSTERKSPTIHSSPSQSQQPTRLPPLPPRPATAISPGSQPPNCKRTTSCKSRNPTAANTQITQPSGTNSQTVQESGPQENPTNGSRDDDGVHQDPQLPAASPDRQIIRELFPAIEQELLRTGQALPQGLMEALCFLPSSPPHVRRTIARPLGIPANTIGPLSPESISSNDGEADRRANNEVIVSQMVFSRFAPQDDDLVCTVLLFLN
ncbi:hypothetical protein L6164_024047 [Bauhinia variegata]|uniref:Uncharacterized protein n=1 Tax=Bauhinia variegata TaxID=167791 RepID=A0ACB9LWL5_BAUVA|nr:hypothetical protein L6164_024047 [Bauhinia variegata]